MTTIDASPAPTEGPAYSYKINTEALSPLQWSSGYPSCGGSKQSPIDLIDPIHLTVPVPLAFSGSCPNFNLTETSESYKAVVDGGNCAVKANGLIYNFSQFHVHTPSEHTVDGKHFDGEIHFFHKTQNGSAALVVGLFLQKTDDNPEANSIVTALSGVEDNSSTPMTLESYTKLIEAYAHEDQIFNYAGSTTSPPCTEFVDWWVVRKPIQISSTQFNIIVRNLKKLEMSDNGKNARPIQPVNGRTIIVYN
ncbi:hypothetical protein PHPALM_30878 [Phytophthora palmivora]|uniref:Carbonic anhydrase n=1 Tax=Phytophthora palmivora TaxID=4796 RepID=A0A2P4X408_9STRA|nr:hypothetical protein PHPALM_30878 [Phytophthora palmivora]